MGFFYDSIQLCTLDLPNRKSNEPCGGHTTCQENNPSSKSPSNNIPQCSEKVLKCCHSKDSTILSGNPRESNEWKAKGYTKESSFPDLERKKKASTISQKINYWLSKMTFLECQTMPVMTSQITSAGRPSNWGEATVHWFTALLMCNLFLAFLFPFHFGNTF